MPSSHFHAKEPCAMKDERVGKILSFKTQTTTTHAFSLDPVCISRSPVFWLITTYWSLHYLKSPIAHTFLKLYTSVVECTDIVIRKTFSRSRKEGRVCSPFLNFFLFSVLSFELPIFQRKEIGFGVADERKVDCVESRHEIQQDKWISINCKTLYGIKPHDFLHRYI